MLDTVIVTEPSGKMDKTAVFVHHLYCPIINGDSNGGAKLYVTENIKDEHKFYLTKIEMESIDSSSQSKSSDRNSSKDSVISVADIFDFVKKNNGKFESDSKQPAKFNPKPVNPEFLNSDGTPKIFYHGTNTFGFSEFNTDQIYLTRLLFISSENASDSSPIVPVIDLMPTEGGMLITDMQKVVTASSRDNIANLIKSSQVLYADKKRSLSLLRTIGLSAYSYASAYPTALNGLVDSVSYEDNNVKIGGVDFSKIFSQSSNSSKTADTDTYIADAVDSASSVTEVLKDYTGKRKLQQSVIERLADGKIRGILTASNEQNGDIRYSVKDDIVDDAGNHYGRGVYLDSNFFDELEDKEKEDLMRDLVENMVGDKYTLTLTNGKKFSFVIKDSGKTFFNGKRSVSVNHDLKTKFSNYDIKHQGIALFNELLSTGEMTPSKLSTHSHDWVDNFGNNDWNYLETIVQEKDNTVKKAVLHFAKAQNGENVLYDITFGDPIKKSNGNGLSVILTARNNNIIKTAKSQSPNSSKTADTDTYIADAVDSASSVTEVLKDYTGKRKLQQSVAEDYDINVHSDGDKKIPKHFASGFRVLSHYRLFFRRCKLKGVSAVLVPFVQQEVNRSENYFI